MQVSFFCGNGYLAREAFSHPGGWPTPPALYRPEVGLQSLQAALAQAKLADDVGFDWVSCSEHHYTPLLQTPNAAVFAAAYDTNPDETRSRTQEASILIIRALTEQQPFGWEGRHYRFRTVSVWPGPIQRPHPPMYYSGNSLESATFAAAHRLGLGISFYPPHIVAELIGHYKQECAKHGWEPSPDHLLYRCFAAVCEDDKEAEAVSAAFSGMRHAVESLMQGRSATLPRPPQSQVGLGLGELRFSGSPDTLVRQLTDFHEATGVGVIDFGFAGEPTKAIRLFGTEVLPRIRHIGARLSQAPQLAVAAAD
jgi:alkanesulfonate monooxygenase SsuD/methylene tetrahydromethanopterin reductase-like flavin-dependent oxidoreductase (luciferase family)